MPYPGELASPTSHVELLKDQRFYAPPKRWFIVSRHKEGERPRDLEIRDVSDLPRARDIDTVTAIDGSYQEVHVDAGFVTAVVQLGLCVIDVGRYLGSANAHGRPVNRQQLDGSILSARVAFHLASNGAIPLKGGTGFDLWREDCYLALADNAIEVAPGVPMSTLDALMAMYGIPGEPAEQVFLHRCPYAECTARNILVPREGTYCAGCGHTLYPTDLLGTHQEYTPEGSNGAALDRLMSAAERILPCGLISDLWIAAPQSMGRRMIFVDGPLAFFGPTSPMADVVSRWQQMLSAAAKQSHVSLPVVVGIEKTGMFVDHAHRIESFFRPGQFAIPTDSYIAKEIRPASNGSTRPRNFNGYYGRHVIYKTKNDKMVVFMIPPSTGSLPYGAEEQGHRDGFANPEAYGELSTACAVIDKMGSSAYGGSLVPITTAHEVAAISTSSRAILAEVERRALDLPKRSMWHTDTTLR